MRKTPYYLLGCIVLFVINATRGFGQGCPTIEILTPAGLTNAGDSFVVSAMVKSSLGVGSLKYAWTVSSGALADGQGSPTLSIATTREDAGKNISVTVKVEGLPSVCENKSTELVGIAPVFGCNMPADEFGAIKAPEVRAHIDNLFIHLISNPDMVALFEMEFSANETPRARKLRITRILDAIQLRKYDLDKVIFHISSEENQTTTRVRILPLSADYNKWINSGTLVYGRDMKQKLPTLFNDK
ncbi:MAG: hypothetical protein ACKVQW_06735 [Pyrinomonadaceae bacterium]